MMTCSAGSSGTEGSRRSPGSMGSQGSSFKDLQKWPLFSVRAEDIEVCKHPDGTPVELGRGGFCRVSSCQHFWPRVPYCHPQGFAFVGLKALE